MAKKAILYINQFFGQIGGEEKAHIAPELHEGPVGPAAFYQKCLGDEVTITHTIICGDNYMGSDPKKATAEIVDMIKGLEFDLFFAGPAFMAGRYGTACGNICKAVSDKFSVPVFTSMNEENPGVEMFQEDMYIFKGAKSAAGMRQDVSKVCAFALKHARGETLLPAAEEGYFERRFRKEVFTEKTAYNRAVDMLLDVLAGRPYTTEMPMYVNEIPKTLPPINLKKSKIALITTWASELTDERHSTSMLKKLQCLSTVGGMLMGPVPGLIADACGNYKPFYAFEGLCLIYALLAVQLVYARKKR